MYCMYKKNAIIIGIFAISLMFLTSCAYKNVSDKSEINTTNTLESKIVDSESFEQSINSSDFIDVKILDKKVISINKNRIGDGDIYGVDHIDNKWDLDEIDGILNAIKGSWMIDSYVGFVAPTIYYLPESFDNIDENKMLEAQNNYNEKVEKAKSNIPKIYFSIKELDRKDSNNNYIYVNGSYPSPISIVLSFDRLNDYYPIFKNQTAVSSDFFAEYPIIYIKFFIEFNIDDQTKEYKPATLVLSSDNRFFILIDGAFYSLKNF